MVMKMAIKNISNVLQALHNPEAREKLNRLGENMIWIIANRESLRKNHPDEYVAVDGGKVIAHNKDLSKLMAYLKSKLRDIDHVAVDFVGKKEVEMILVRK